MNGGGENSFPQGVTRGGSEGTSSKTERRRKKTAKKGPSRVSSPVRWSEWKLEKSSKR